MSILINKRTKVICQGITGQAGLFHTEQCLKYGTKMVGGVTPGKGGTKAAKLPVFDSVEEAVKETGATASMIFVPAAFACDAVLEAADAGIELIITITEGIPVSDMVKVKRYLAAKPNIRMIGPNCPGVITPGECKIGIMPGYIHKKGKVGIISRSGTLTYEVVYALTRDGIGQSTVVGIGGDPIQGSSFIDLLELFEKDKGTNVVIVIGEIGGTSEERAAEFIEKKMKKPVIAFIAGKAAPPGRRMGHAGAIISGGQGTWQGKVKALRQAGIRVAESTEEITPIIGGLV
ncbi:MAG: succinate--CoA ligase subunit alpha [Candidatus Omnitrophica bacterium]|nr:succinate--CoA ligase subunit alpha [Candidatus Omnitrophota bacterium]